jgi:hypothetical protein
MSELVLVHRLRASFDLRQQIGKLIVAELVIFPVDFNAGTVFDHHFAFHPIRGPHDRLVELEILGILCVHT